MIENVDGTKMIRRVENVEKTGFFDVGCQAGLFRGVFGLIFLANLLLNVNMLLISATWEVEFIIPAGMEKLIFHRGFISIVFQSY